MCEVEVGLAAKPPEFWVSVGWLTAEIEVPPAPSWIRQRILQKVFEACRITADWWFMCALTTALAAYIFVCKINVQEYIVLSTLETCLARWSKFQACIPNRNRPRFLQCVFRWFEMGCAIWAQMGQISASQIKAHIGSIFQKYVYSSFIVKMRIDLGSFGLLWFILGWDNARGRNLSNLNFWVSEVKKVKSGSAEKIRCEFRNVSVSQKAQIFSERSIR